MTNKPLLKESIEKLKRNNSIILRRLSKITNKEKIEKLKSTIVKNESMILDYEYRLKFC
jgi:hypothetical protein